MEVQEVSIYIKNIEMPTTESEVLIIAIESDGSVYPVRIDGDGQPMIFQNEEIKNCAIPIPPHGRLGDLDELHKEAVRRSEKARTYDSWYNCTDRVISAFDIESAPTIIPASGKDVDPTTKEEACCEPSTP